MMNSFPRTYSGLDPTIRSFRRVTFLQLGMNLEKVDTHFGECNSYTFYK